MHETSASAYLLQAEFVNLERQVRFASASVEKLCVNTQIADPDIDGEPGEFRFGVDRNRTNCVPEFPGLESVQKIAEKKVVACSW